MHGRGLGTLFLVPMFRFVSILLCCSIVGGYVCGNGDGFCHIFSSSKLTNVFGKVAFPLDSSVPVCLSSFVAGRKNINIKQGSSGNEKLNSYCERIGNFPRSLQELINKFIVSNSRKIIFCQKSIMNSHLLVLIILTPPFHLQESGAPLQQHVLFIVVEGMNWKHCLTELHTLNSIAIQIMFLQKCLPLRWWGRTAQERTREMLKWYNCVKLFQQTPGESIVLQCPSIYPLDLSVKLAISDSIWIRTQQHPLVPVVLLLFLSRLVCTYSMFLNMKGNKLLDINPGTI